MPDVPRDQLEAVAKGRCGNLKVRIRQWVAAPAELRFDPTVHPGHRDVE
jgi:hypothetical protein